MSGFAALHLVALVTGAAFGALYLTLLWWSVRRLTGHGICLAFLLAGLARLCLLIAAFVVALALGATASHIAAGLLGFVGVRTVATRSKHGAVPWT